MTATSALPQVQLGRTGLRVSTLGLGCSRLGSTMAACSPAEAASLVAHALDRGVTLFDTADIYGQGESERTIGRVLAGRRDGVVVVTKVGQRFTRLQRLAMPAKRIVKVALRHVPGLGGTVARQRAGRLPRDFSERHVRAALDASRRRLRMDCLDIVLLHSPDADEIAAGASVDLLERAQHQGVISHWGISCDDAPAVEAALRVPEVAVLQLPLALLQRTPDLVRSIAARRIGLLVREIFAPSASPATCVGMAVDWRADRLRAVGMITDAVALVGTTRRPHLDAALDASASFHNGPTRC